MVYPVSLEHLIASNSKLSSTGAAALCEGSPMLTALALSLCPTIRDWSFLGELKHLADLDLSLNFTVGDDAVAIIGDTMPALRYLNLEKTGISNECTSSLGKLTALRVLDLRRNNAIGDAIGVGIATMPNLEALMLSFTDVTDALAFNLTSLANLRCLKLTGARLFGDNGLHHLSLSETLPTSLAALDVGSPIVTDAARQHLCVLKGLESLTLWETSVSIAAADSVADALGLTVDDQIRCTSGTYIMLTTERLLGVH